MGSSSSRPCSPKSKCSRSKASSAAMKYNGRREIMAPPPYEHPGYTGNAGVIATRPLRSRSHSSSPSSSSDENWEAVATTVGAIIDPVDTPFDVVWDESSENETTDKEAVKAARKAERKKNKAERRARRALKRATKAETDATRTSIKSAQRAEKQAYKAKVKAEIAGQRARAAAIAATQYASSPAQMAVVQKSIPSNHAHLPVNRAVESNSVTRPKPSPASTSELPSYSCQRNPSSERRCKSDNPLPPLPTPPALPPRRKSSGLTSNSYFPSNPTQSHQKSNLEASYAASSFSYTPASASPTTSLSPSRTKSDLEEQYRDLVIRQQQ